MWQRPEVDLTGRTDRTCWQDVGGGSEGGRGQASTSFLAGVAHGSGLPLPTAGPQHHGRARQERVGQTLRSDLRAGSGRREPACQMTRKRGVVLLTSCSSVLWGPAYIPGPHLCLASSLVAVVIRSASPILWLAFPGLLRPPRMSYSRSWPASSCSAPALRRMVFARKGRHRFLLTSNMCLQGLLSCFQWWPKVVPWLWQVLLKCIDRARGQASLLLFLTFRGIASPELMNSKYVALVSCSKAIVAPYLPLFPGVNAASLTGWWNKGCQGPFRILCSWPIPSPQVQRPSWRWLSSQNTPLAGRLEDLG